MTRIDTSPDSAQIQDEYVETAENTRPASVLLRELVAHLRDNRTQLREEWARRITEAKLLTAMTKDEIFAEATSVYDNYVEALETGTLRRCRPTRATCPNASFREVLRPMKSLGLCSCSATSLPARCSPSTRLTSPS